MMIIIIIIIIIMTTETTGSAILSHVTGVGVALPQHGPIQALGMAILTPRVVMVMVDMVDIVLGREGWWWRLLVALLPSLLWLCLSMSTIVIVLHVPPHGRGTLHHFPTNVPRIVVELTHELQHSQGIVVVVVVAVMVVVVVVVVDSSVVVVVGVGVVVVGRTRFVRIVAVVVILLLQFHSNSYDNLSPQHPLENGILIPTTPRNAVGSEPRYQD